MRWLSLRSSHPYVPRANAREGLIIQTKLCGIGDRRLDQSEVLRHGMKVTVVVEQRLPVFYAPGADQEVDGLADGYAAPEQGAEIASRRDRNRLASHRDNLKAAQDKPAFWASAIRSSSISILVRIGDPGCYVYILVERYTFTSPTAIVAFLLVGFTWLTSARC